MRSLDENRAVMVSKKAGVKFSVALAAVQAQRRLHPDYDRAQVIDAAVRAVRPTEPDESEVTK